MATLAKTKVSLRIIGDDLVPDQVTELLGCEPTRKMTKDQPFSLPNGKTRIAKSGMWRLEATERVPGNLDDQIAELLGQFDASADVWESLAETYRVEMFCGLFMESHMEGISISSASMLALGQRGIEIDFDIYGPDDETV